MVQVLKVAEPLPGIIIRLFWQKELKEGYPLYKYFLLFLLRKNNLRN